MKKKNPRIKIAREKVRKRAKIRRKKAKKKIIFAKKHFFSVILSEAKDL